MKKKKKIYLYLSIGLLIFLSLILSLDNFKSIALHFRLFSAYHQEEVEDKYMISFGPKIKETKVTFSQAESLREKGEKIIYKPKKNEIMLLYFLGFIYPLFLLAKKLFVLIKKYIIYIKKNKKERLFFYGFLIYFFSIILMTYTRFANELAYLLNILDAYELTDSYNNLRYLNYSEVLAYLRKGEPVIFKTNILNFLLYIFGGLLIFIIVSKLEKSD